MSVEQTNIQGDLAVSRHLTVGGTATVRNDAEFARGVTIKGWLDAPNTKHAFKGLYASIDDLQSAYPSPQTGWYALIADLNTWEGDPQTLELTAEVYWVKDGEWCGSNFTSAQLTQYVAQVEQQLQQLDEEITETLEKYVQFTDVVVADNNDTSNNKNGVVTPGMAYELYRLHRASGHISYFLDGEHSILSGKPSVTRSIYYLPDLKTFAASAVGESETSPTLYREWDENTDMGFHDSSAYLTGSYKPLSKLYFNGNYAYIWDSNQEEMIHLGDMTNYVSFVDYATSSKAGVVKVSIGNGLTITDGLLALSLATTAAAGAMSASDKAKLDEVTISKVVQSATATGLAPLTLSADINNGHLSIEGHIAEATTSASGVMSARDKALLDNVALGIPYFTGILNGMVTTSAGTLTDVHAVWWVTAAQTFVAESTAGRYYSTWEASGAFMSSSDYFANSTNKIYNSGGLLYRYDENEETLVAAMDHSTYVTFSDVATTEQNGLLSTTDKAALDFVSDAIISGHITNGTMRFNNYCCSKRLNGSIDETTVADSYDGVMWLKDKKMFVAYRAITVLDDCGCASIYFTFYTHWITAHLYMEEVATEEGLWKDKVYIYNGSVYVWKTCEKQLVQISGSGDIEELTEEEIDDLVADFEFVDGGSGTGITSIEAKGESPLNLSATPNGTEVLIEGSVDIGEITPDEVSNMFDTING